MPMHKSVLFFLLLALSRAPVVADGIVSGTYLPYQDGFRVSVTVTAVPAQLGYDARVNSLRVFAVDVGDVVSPPGWTGGPGPGSAQWVGQPAYWIIPISSLSGFGFVTSEVSADMRYEVSTAGGGSGLGHFTPVLVPEPAPALPLALGMAGMWTLRVRKPR